MHGVGPMNFIAENTISPDRFKPTSKNPGISFTAVPPSNYAIEGWPNGTDEQRKRLAAHRLPRLSRSAKVVTTTPAAVYKSLARIGITPRFIFNPTREDPFHAELNDLPPPGHPLSDIAANLVLSAISCMEPLANLLAPPLGD